MFLPCVCSYTRIDSIYSFYLFVVADAQARSELLQNTLNGLVIFIFVISGWEELVCIQTRCIRIEDGNGGDRAGAEIRREKKIARYDRANYSI